MLIRKSFDYSPQMQVSWSKLKGFRWCSRQSKRLSPLHEIVGPILATDSRRHVKRVSQRSAESPGFLRVLRFPPTGKVDRVG